MSEAPPADLRDTIREASEFYSMAVDGETITHQSLTGLIAADEYLKQQEIAENPTAAIQPFRIAGKSMR